MKIIGIIGTRKRDKFKDYKVIEKEFFKNYEEGDWICSGGCPRGADRFAEKIAKKNGIPMLTFYANWTKNGLGAGMVRNTDVAKNSNILIAVVSNCRTGGTEDTIKKFIKFCKEDHLILI